jgi:hypothetical protein
MKVHFHVLNFLCDSCNSCVTQREEHRLRVFENKVQRRIFRPKREEVAGGWRSLHNEELHNLYASPNIIGVIKSRMGRACGTHGSDEKCIRVFGQKTRRE